MTNFKPKNYPDISTYMVLDDPEVSLGFIERLFGGERLRIVRDGEGAIRHGEIRIGEAVIMMGGSMPGWPAQPASFYHYVPDVDAVYRRAIELGAISVQEPVKQDDADKRGGFRDPGGIVWWIATQIDTPAETG